VVAAEPSPLELEQEQQQEPPALALVALHSTRRVPQPEPPQEPQSHLGSRSVQEYCPEPGQEPLSSCIRSKLVLLKELCLLQKPVICHAWNLSPSRI
jgi:hypothetical protein